MRFPNNTGHHADADDVFASELMTAGIVVMRAAMLRDLSIDVKTSVRGHLHGWSFVRAWHHWICTGPGIEIGFAERLHAFHGRTVRVAGYAESINPRSLFKGLACGVYHVDDAEGLKALADTIRAIVAANAPDESPESQLALTLLY